MRYYPDLMLLFYFCGVFISFAVRYAHGGDSKPVLQPCLVSLIDAMLLSFLRLQASD